MLGTSSCASQAHPCITLAQVRLLWGQEERSLSCGPTGTWTFVGWDEREPKSAACYGNLAWCGDVWYLDVLVLIRFQHCRTSQESLECSILPHFNSFQSFLTGQNFGDFALPCRQGCTREWPKQRCSHAFIQRKFLLCLARRGMKTHYSP